MARRKGNRWSGVNAARARKAQMRALVEEARARGVEVAGAAEPQGPELNKAERLRLAELLALRQAGEVEDFTIQGIKLRLGRGSWYLPDFVVYERLDGVVRLVCEEVKGAKGWSLDDESRTKWKVAAEQHPRLIFRGVTMGAKGAAKVEYARPWGMRP